MAGARAAYERVIDSGHADAGALAAHNLGLLLAEQGDAAGARAACERAIESGHRDWAPKAMRNLGNLLADQPGREREAEAAFREAAEAGNTNAWVNLGLLLAKQPGREAEAEAAYREAIDAGNSLAPVNLGNLLAEQPGREREAEATYREAAEAGNADARFNLGLLLAKQPGREAEAEAAYREAIDAGNSLAPVNLGNLLAEQPGREEEAEAAFREAAAAGIEYAWRNLGRLLAKQPGREGEAEAAFREAIAEGDADAWNSLGWMLAKQPGRAAEAEAAYREAATAGNSLAPDNLGNLLKEQGGEEEWRLRAEFSDGGAAEEFVQRLFAGEVGRSVDPRVRRGVSRDGSVVFAYASTEVNLRALAGAVDSVIEESGQAARVSLGCWGPETQAWRRRDAGDEDRVERDDTGTVGSDDEEWPLSQSDWERIAARLRLSVPAVKAAALALALACAAGGIIWYALSPGVASYQAGFLLLLPALIIPLFWLGRRLPIWMQWTLAIPLAPIGPIGYLVAGGAQWWNWGQLTALPLMMLAIAMRIRSSDDDEPRYGGPFDGPWGPP